MHRVVTGQIRKFTAEAVFGILLLWFSAIVSAQAVVDKTVATVSDGVRTELITL